MEAPHPTRAVAQPPLARCLYSVCSEAPVPPGDGLYSPQRWSTFAVAFYFSLGLGR